MPGNTPNVSRNSFDITKNYQKVTLQQGVPIPDSDWNELQDNLRIWLMLLTEYALGNFFIDDAYLPATASSPANNFEITEGSALIEGTHILTTMADPPAAIDYEDDTNYMVKGTIDAINGGANTVTDNEQNLQTFHDLVSTSDHGPARMKMLTGAEAGNSFNISSHTATVITLSGGIGSIGIGDTYVIKPPALTTPGGARTDQVYLMVWWEDIAKEEDSNIEHPSLGVETAHRDQLRWCVRVNEDSVTVPSTPTSHGFGVRYLKRCAMARTAAANITIPGTTTLTAVNDGVSYYDHQSDTSNPHGTTATLTTFTPYSFLAATNVQAAIQELIDDLAARQGQDIGINTDFANDTLTAINGGGLGDLDPGTLQAAISKINSVVVNRRAFTAVLTDGTASTGGDYNGANAVDNLDTITDGVFFVRRGSYTFTQTSLSTKCHVLGEGNDITTIIASSSLSADMEIIGTYQNVYLKTAATAYGYSCEDELNLKDIRFDSGVFTLEDGRLYWKGGEQAAVGTGTQASTFLVNGTSGDPSAIIEDVVFGDPPSGGSQTNCLSIVNVSYPEDDKRAGKGIIFRNCRFEPTTGGVHALNMGTCSAPITFENCSFEVPIGTGYCAKLLTVNGVRFKNCSFVSPSGYLLQTTALGSVVFEDCYFRAGDDTTQVDHQIMHVRSSPGDVTAFRNCRISIGDCLADQVTGVPAIEFGGQSGSQTADAQNILVDGLDIELDSSIANIQGDSFLVLWGPNGTEMKTTYRDITLHLNGNTPSVTGANNGFANGGSSDRAWVEVIGASGDSRPIVENLRVTGANGRSSSVTTMGGIVNLQRCDVKGLSIEGVNTVTTGRYSGNLTLYSNVDVYHPVINEYQPVPNSSVDVNMIGPSRIFGGKLASTFNLARPALIYTSAYTELYEFFVDVNPEATTKILVGNSSPQDVVVDGCTFDISGSSRDLTEIDLTSSKNSQFTNNKLTIDKSGSSNTTVSFGTSTACLIDSNVVLSVSATAPTVAATGTGAVVGDNVLAANA
jgi:hypothetical protein